MKKMFGLIASMVSVTVLLAQDKPVIGLKAGANIATFHSSESGDDYKAKVGLHVGLLAHIHVTPQVAFQPELVYSQQGPKFTEGGVDGEFKANYVNLPLMLQYMFNNGFRIETGPQFGLLVSNENLLEKTDLSLGFGLSYLTYSGVGIGARYNLGLSNINDYDPANKTKNRVLQLGLFYMFDSQHKRKSR